MKNVLTRPSPPSKAETRKQVLREHEAIGREQAVRYTRGNVAIQQNAFVTKKDVEEGLTEFSPYK